MLVSVVMVFIVCQVPALIYNVSYAIDYNYTQMSQSWAALSTVRNFLVNLNSAINFILYCAFGQKFRRTFMRTFCPCWLKPTPNGFHSFTGFHHHNADGHVGMSPSSSTNGAVYMKLIKSNKKQSLVPTRGNKALGVPKNGKSRKAQNGRAKGAGGGGGGNALRNNPTQSSYTDLTKLTDHDSGVVVTKYSSPCNSSDSANTSCVDKSSTVFVSNTGSGRSKPKVIVNERTSLREKV